MNLDLIILLLILISLYKIKIIRPSDPGYEEYLSLDRTNAIKGVLAILLVSSHIAQYLTDPQLSTSIFGKFTPNGYLFVCFFFFYSGFGLMKKRIGNVAYLDSFFSRRIKPILFTYALVHLFYIPAYAITGRGSSLVEAVMSLVLYGATYVQHSWFIIAIIVHYIVFWLVSYVFKDRYPLYVLGSTVCYLVYVILCRRANYPSYWYICCGTFGLGIFWAYKEKEIFQLIRKHYYPLLFSATACFVTLFHFRDRILALLQASVLSPVFYGVLCCLFTISVTLLTVRVVVNNAILQFLGKLSLTLYLFHGMYVSIFDPYLWEWIPQEFLRCSVALALSILTAVFYRSFEAAVKKGLQKIKSACAS